MEQNTFDTIHLQLIPEMMNSVNEIYSGIFFMKARLNVLASESQDGQVYGELGLLVDEFKESFVDYSEVIQAGWGICKGNSYDLEAQKPLDSLKIIEKNNVFSTLVLHRLETFNEEICGKEREVVWKAATLPMDHQLWYYCQVFSDYIEKLRQEVESLMNVLSQ